MKRRDTQKKRMNKERKFQRKKEYKFIHHSCLTLKSTTRTNSVSTASAVEWNRSTATNIHWSWIMRHMKWKSFLQQKLHSKWESEKRMKGTGWKKNYRERIQRKHRCSPRCPTASYFVFYLLCYFFLSFSMSLQIACYRHPSNFSKQQNLAVLFFFTLISFVSSIVRYDKRHDFFFSFSRNLYYFFCCMKLLTSDDTQLVRIPIIYFH